MANWSVGQSIDSEKFHMQNCLRWDREKETHTLFLVVVAHIRVEWEKPTHKPYSHSVHLDPIGHFLSNTFSPLLSLSISEWICVWCVLSLASYVLCHTNFEEAIKTTAHTTKYTHQRMAITCRFVDSGHKNRFEWLTYDIEFYIYKDIKLP